MERNSDNLFVWESGSSRAAEWFTFSRRDAGVPGPVEIGCRWDWGGHRTHVSQSCSRIAGPLERARMTAPSLFHSHRPVEHTPQIEVVLSKATAKIKSKKVEARRRDVFSTLALSCPLVQKLEREGE